MKIEEGKGGKCTRSSVLIDQSFPFAAQVTRNVFGGQPISPSTPGHHPQTSVGTFELLLQSGAKSICLILPLITQQTAPEICAVVSTNRK